MDNSTLRQYLFEIGNLSLGEVGVILEIKKPYLCELLQTLYIGQLICVDFKPTQLRKPRQGTYIGDPVFTNIEMCQLCQPRQGTYITDLVVGQC